MYPCSQLADSVGVCARHRKSVRATPSVLLKSHLAGAVPCCREFSTSQRSPATEHSSWVAEIDASGGNSALVQGSQSPAALSREESRNRRRRQQQHLESPAGATSSGRVAPRKKAKKSNGGGKGISVTASALPPSPRRRRQPAPEFQAAQHRSSESTGFIGEAQVDQTDGSEGEKPVTLGAWHNIAVEPTTKALEPDVVIRLLADGEFCPGARPISFSPDPIVAPSWIFKEGEFFHTRRKAASGASVPRARYRS